MKKRNPINTAVSLAIISIKRYRKRGMPSCNFSFKYANCLKKKKKKVLQKTDSSSCQIMGDGGGGGSYVEFHIGNN